MPSQTDWRSRFLLSSVDLDALKRQWADKGRQVYDHALRTGRNVLARTESELQALGRAELALEAMRSSQDKVVREAAQRAVQSAAAKVRGGLVAVGTSQAQSDELRRKQDAVVAQSAAGAAKTAIRGVRPGSPTDPGPGRLAAEWATGGGPERRVLGPESAFSREFVEAPSVRRYLEQYVRDWREQEGGLTGAYSNPPNQRAKFGATEFMDDLVAGNGASHFIGTWGVQGRRRGDQIDWAAENDTDTTSFFYGRPFREIGLPHVPSYPRYAPGGLGPRPGGRTHQTIEFSTDLEGRPIPQRR